MATDSLSATLAALADPTRRAIVERLADGEASVSELAAPFSISMPAITKHLKVLERAGLITRGRSAQWRPCRLETAPLRNVAAWLEHYRRHWEGRLDRMEDYLTRLPTEPSVPATGGGPPSTEHPTPKQEFSS